jgi:hypothetical protein
LRQTIGRRGRIQTNPNREERAMKSLKKDMQSITREMKALTKKTERLMKAVDKLEKAQIAAKKKAKPTSKAKSAKKAPARKVVAKKKTTKKIPAKRKTVTATDRVLNVVKKSKKGIDVPVLMKKTGFDEKKVRNIISRAYGQRKIKRVGRGLYVSA